jgi:hypothetical protein
MVNARKISTAVTSLCGFALLTVSGCVMQSTYDAALKEGLTTKSELAHELEAQEALTRQVSDLELQNADVMREAESAAAALQQARDDAEHERRQLEEMVARLTQKVAQATKQQRSLRYELTVAKENTAALQERIDVHQRKVQDGIAVGRPGPAGEPAVHAPFDPSTIPLPEDLPALPAVASQQAVPAPAPIPAPAASGTKPPEPPSPEEDWLTSIKNWLLSLWRSVFT